MPNPLLSVCTATVGRPSLVTRSAPSALAAAPGDALELVVATSADVVAGVRADLAALGDDRVRVVEAAGAAGARRNVAVAASSGEWLLFLDDDDALAEGWWDALAPFLGDGAVSLVSGRTIEVEHDADGPLPDPQPHVELGPLHGGGLGTFLAGTFAVRRELFDAVGGYDARFVSSENWELSIRLVREVRRRGGDVTLLDLVLLHQRRSRAAGDHRSAEVAELMSQKYAVELAAMPIMAARYSAQAGVGWAREGDLAAARRSFTTSLRQRPADPAAWGRLLVSMVPLLARRRWPPYPPGLS